MLPRFVYLTVCAGVLHAAPASVALRYLGEIGQLGLTQVRGNKIDLGTVEVSVGASYTFSGKQSPWRFPLPYHGETSATHVFAADLDKNGREDLVIVNQLPGDSACGTNAGDVTLLLMDQSQRPQAWQSTMRLAKTQRDQDAPLYLTDRNGDGFVEISVVACAGEAPALHAVYETRPEGVVPVATRTWSSYGGEVRKLYRNKSLAVPKEDAAPAPEPAPPSTMIDQVATPQWGQAGSPPTVRLTGGAQMSAWPKLAVAVTGFRLIRPTGHDLTDLLDLLARGTPVRADDARLLRTYPSDTSQTTPLTAKLVAGTPRVRTIAVVEGDVPRNARDASYFLIRGSDCYAFHVGASVGAMRSAGCEAAQTLRARGLSREPIHIREAHVTQTNAAEWRAYHADDGRETKRLHLAGEGKLETVTPVDDFLLSQWRTAEKAWLTLHLENGTPITGNLTIPATDQLLYVDESQGLVFLRWQGDRPAAWVELPARVEWQRAQ